MQKLHLVGFTTDHKGLILSARRGARSGGFVLAIDDAVAEAVASALARAEEVAEPDEELHFEELAPPRPQSALSVKELQARLRSGRTVESVAAEAGVDVEWVIRFAAPVISEQIRVIDDTRNATFSRARLGPSALRLGPSVYRNLAAKGLTTPADELDKGWTTRQISDGRWLVTFSYVSRGRKQKASWELDLRGGEVRAIDRLGAELAFVPGAPKPATPAAAPTKPVKVPATGATDVDRANARRVAEARKAAEAQLAEAARRSTKHSAEVAKRAARTPKAGAQRATRAVVEVAAPVDPVDGPTAGAVDEAVALVDGADGVAVDEAVAEVEAPPADDVDAAADELGAAADPAPVVRADRPRDPAASAVAMVREAAEAMLSDFASGRLTDADLVGDRALPTWEDPSAEDAGAEDWPSAPADEPSDDDGADDDLLVDEEPLDAPAAELEEEVPAARPVPSRRRRPPVAARPSPAAAAPPAPEPEPEPARPASARPSRALTRAAAPPPLALEEVAAPPASPRRTPTFRDDLAAPAQGNGDVPPPPAAPRRRRSQPLRAR